MTSFNMIDVLIDATAKAVGSGHGAVQEWKR